MVTKIPVGQPEHQAVADAVEVIGRGYVLLRHASASARTERRETRGRGRSKGAKGRVRGCDKVRVEMIGRVIRIGSLPGESHERVRRTRWRQSWPIQISGQKGIDRAAERSDRADESSRCTGQHLRAIESKRLRSKIRSAGGVEDVHAHVVTVGPDTQVGIIKKVTPKVKAVAVV